MVLGGTTGERLNRLENRIVEAEQQLAILDAWRALEVRERQAETAEERAERVSEADRIRGDIADLAGGGLRLQAWGVACLVAGTVMTAFW
jgi:hypothetical protein